MAVIYKITNTINNKVYIGSSKNILARFKAHYNNLASGTHINKHLQASYNKHKKEAFKFEVITNVPETILRRAEQYYINKYKALDPKFGYNKAVANHNTYDGKQKAKKPINKIYYGAYSKEGKLVKVFKSQKEAAKFFNFRKTSGITISCNSDFTKSALGYYWLKLDVTKQCFPKFYKKGSRKGRHRSIKQFSLDGVFIKEWESAVSAAKELKLSSFNITRCLNSNNVYKKFRWYYSAP